MPRYVVVNLKTGFRQDYLSVTELMGLINKPYLIDWAVREVCKIATEHNGKENIAGIMLNRFSAMRQDILDVGDKIHSLIEIYIQCKIKGEEFSQWDIKDERELYGFSKFLDFERDNVSEWLLSEYVVYSEELCLAGRLDAVYKNKEGEVVLCDFKSSKAIYKEYEIQCYMYAHIFNSMNDGEFEVIFKEDKKNEMTFRQCHKKLKIDKAQIVLVGKSDSKLRVKDVVIGSFMALRFEVVMKGLIDVFYFMTKRQMSNKLVSRVEDLNKTFIEEKPKKSKGEKK